MGETLSDIIIEKSRFFSEYGFQSFPEFESVKIYAPQERDWSINSEVMMAHQRAGSYANNLIKEYMDQEYRTPYDFPTFLYVGMILQGDAIKTAIEAHRRDMPHCMGTLVWQHNDCWPVASWAGRDYYGRWKAQQYFSRYAYDDILVSPLVLGDSVTVNIVSDRRKATKGTFTMNVIDINGNTITTKQFKHTARPLTSTEIVRTTVKDLIEDHKRGDVLICVSYETDGKTYRNIGYATKQKHMNYRKPTITTDITPADGGYNVTVTTDIFARGLFLSIDGIDNFFSDNYFDVLPGNSRTIHVSTRLPLEDFRAQLKIKTLGDTY